MMLEVVAFAVCLLSHVLCVSAQDEESGKLQHTLTFAIPFSIVTIVIIVIFIIVVYMLYRAKRGYFCCLKPTYRLPPSRHQDSSSSDEEDGRQDAGEGGEQETEATSALPPNYNQGLQQRPLDIAPPDYRDALQDMVVDRSEDSSAIREPTSLPTTPDPIPSTATPTGPTPTQEATSPPPPEGVTGEEPTPTTTREEGEVTTENPEDLEESSESYDDTTPLNP